MKLIKVKPAKLLLYRLIKLLELYAQRSRTRRQLLEMDAYALKDIGLTRHQALREGELYFWQGSRKSLDGCDELAVTEAENQLKLGQTI